MIKGEHHSMGVHHAVTAAKVGAGGAVTAATTYAAVEWTTHAQELATFAATVMTAVYFAFMALRAAFGFTCDILDRRAAKRKSNGG
jgi:hypothetical protein